MCGVSVGVVRSQYCPFWRTRSMGCLVDPMDWGHSSFCVCVCVCVCVCAVAILAQGLERGASAPQQLFSNLPSFKLLLEVCGGGEQRAGKNS